MNKTEADENIRWTKWFGKQRHAAFIRLTQEERRKEKKKEHLLDYKSTVWCGFPTLKKEKQFMNFQK